MTEVPDRHPKELLKYGSEPFKNYVDQNGDVMPVSNLTSGEMDEALVDHAGKQADVYVIPPLKSETTRRKIGRRAYGRPPVGEEERLLNVENHSGAQTLEDKEVMRRNGDKMERDIMIHLDGLRQTAIEMGDTETAIRIDLQMEARRKRREELGYGQVDTSSVEDD